ncbi:MAG: hypothetical protein IKL49_04470 [Lachnospiraceae bacterium]|nr:hypothetical protein [Lachnospiraceae bacterium]
MKTDFLGIADWLNQPQVLTKAMKISRLLSVLLGILTIAGLILLAVIIWPVITSGRGMLVFELLDEMDDLVEVICFMGGGAIVLAVISRFLKNKNRQVTQ